MNKIDKKYVSYLKVLSFLLVFLILLEGLSFTVFSQANASSFKNKYSKAYSFMAEPENSIQVACIGNSDLYSGFVPAKLFREYGYVSTVIGSPRQNPKKSYILLTELLKKQNPKIVILETDMLYDEDIKERNLNTDDSRNSEQIDDLLAFFDEDNFKTAIEEHCSIFMFHNRWKTLGRPDKSTDKVNTHGYKFSNKVRRVKRKIKLTETGETEKISKQNSEYFDKMIELCKSKGIAVILTEFPSLNSWDGRRHNIVKKLASDYGVEFYDLNEFAGDVGIDVKKDFRDRGNHLNFDGAVKVTSYLGKIISEKYTLKDCRNESKYDYFASTCDEFEKENSVKL